MRREAAASSRRNRQGRQGLEALEGLRGRRSSWIDVTAGLCITLNLYAPASEPVQEEIDETQSADVTLVSVL